jgi:hypothetical protein
MDRKYILAMVNVFALSYFYRIIAGDDRKYARRNSRQKEKRKA